MDQKVLETRFQELLQDSQFVEKLITTDEPAKIKLLLADYGLEVSDEDVALLTQAHAAAQDAELSAEELDDVSGGWASVVIKKGVPLLLNAIICLKNNLRSDGSMKKCTCGLHRYAVRK